MSGAVKFGIFLSIVGLGLAGTSAYSAREELKDYDKFVEGKIEFVEQDKLRIDASAGTVNIHHSDTTTSYAEYKVYEFYDVKYDENENSLKVRKKWQYNFIWIDSFYNKTTIDIYLTDREYDAYLSLSAGKMNVEEDFHFNSLEINVSAGDFNCNGDVTVNEDVKLNVSAGDLNINKTITTNKETNLRVSAGDLKCNNIVADSLVARISAGNIDCKVKTDKINFNISAGDIDLDVVGNQSEYNIIINKSAGSCNVKNAVGTDSNKVIEGKVSAGDANIHFVTE